MALSGSLAGVSLWQLAVTGSLMAWCISAKGRMFPAWTISGSSSVVEFARDLDRILISRLQASSWGDQLIAVAVAVEASMRYQSSSFRFGNLLYLGNLGEVDRCRWVVSS